MQRMLWLVLCLVAIGCKGSTRSITLSDSQFVVGSPEFLGPAGAIGIAASSNGKLFAVAVPNVEGQSMRFEVREWETRHVMYEFVETSTSDAVMPLMFGSQESTLICASSKAVWSVDMKTGARTQLFTGQMQSLGATRNYDHSILVCGCDQQRYAVISASGKVLTTPTKPRFDAFGSAWWAEKDSISKMDRSGQISEGLMKSPYAVEDQSTVRGPMTLSHKELEQKFEGATAYISTIWISHQGAVLEPGQRAINRAALVTAQPDVYAYGFVPGRNAVYVVSAQGTMIVPFTQQYR
jgi:hypothetical protein